MMKRPECGKRLLFLLSLAVALLVMAWNAAAETSPYRIVLVAPGSWTNSNTAVVQVTIIDINGIGWQKIEYRMNQNAWTDCENRFDGNKADITVRENGTLSLRVTDPSGQQYEETTQIITIDEAAPGVTASIDGNTLKIDVRDDLSGVAGVQVNSMLFTTVTGHTLDVDLDENMNKFEKLAIRAFDYAGNFSEPISLENPHYVKPVDPTPVPKPTATSKPTATPKQTKKPTGTTEATDVPSSTSVPSTPAPADTPVRSVTQPPHGLGSSLIYVSDEDWPPVTAAPTAVPTPAPTPGPIIQTEYITIGPGMPYKADGNSHTLDVLYSAATNKQFITLQSKSGNTFYLVIDYDKPIDAEAELYETYFLNLVDERDLLALMSDEEKEEVPTPTPQVIYVTPEPTAAPAPTQKPAEPEPDKKPNQMTAIIALVGIVAALGVGAFFLLKSRGKNTGSKIDNDFDLDDDEDETEEADDQQV